MIDDKYMETLISEDKAMTIWKRSHKNNNWKVRKYIKGYKRQYMICRNGLVYNKAKETWLKPQQHKNGYFYVVLYLEGKRKNVYLHRLVAAYFVSNPKSLNVVYHLDGDKTNNRAGNIDWTSKSLLLRKLAPENPPYLKQAIDKARAAKLLSIKRREDNFYKIR